MKKAILVMFISFILYICNAIDLSDDVVNTLKLDIDTSIKKAFESNLSLKNNEIDLKNKVLSLATSWNQFIPDTKISASIGRSNNFSDTQANKNTLNAGFETSLALNAKMVFNILQSITDWKTGVITLQQAKKKLSNDIKKYYYNLIILKEQIDLKEKQIENTKTRYDAAIIKLNQGMISEIEKLKNEYAYKSLIPELSNIQNDYQTNLLTFKQIIGIKDDVLIELTSLIPEINSINYEKFKTIPVENNPDIQALYQQLKSDENARNIYISNLTPSLSLSYSLSSSFIKDPFRDAWFNNNDWSNSGMFKLSINVPLDSYFPFSSVQTDIIKGQNKIKMTANNIQDTIEKNKINIITAIMKLKEIENSFNGLLVNIDIAEKTYQLSEKLYMLGNKDFLELKDAENNLFDARLKLLNAKYDYFTNTLDLKYILNIED